MKYIITGHRGLIGSHLKKRLDDLGHECVLAIDLREGNDILDISQYAIKADIVFHLASFCKIAESIKQPRLAYLHNVAGTYAVLEYMRKNEIPKIVFTSSTRVLYPNKNPYVASKIFCEEQIKAYSECYGMEYVIVRPSTVYGPFNDHTGRLVDIWMRAALKDKPLKIYGDRNKTLDFTYVDDFVDGLMIAAQQTNKEYDIASGEPTYLEDVAHYIILKAGGGYVEYHEPETAQPQEVCVDISAIQNLGYSSKVSIVDGLLRTIKFYQKLENL